MYIFLCAMIKCWVVDPDVDGFSHNLFAVLIDYFKVEDVDGNCTDYMTAMQRPDHVYPV